MDLRMQSLFISPVRMVFKAARDRGCSYAGLDIVRIDLVALLARRRPCSRGSDEFPGCIIVDSSPASQQSSHPLTPLPLPPVSSESRTH